MNTSFSLAFSTLLLLTIIAACSPDPGPVGESNPYVAQLELDGWRSVDTILSIDPLTNRVDTSVQVRDLRPDTLRSGEIVYQATEYLPTFAGCETAEQSAICTQQKLNEFVADRLEYPRWAKVRGIQGTTIATFVIGKDGKVRDTGIKQSMGDEIDVLVLRMVEQMTVWHPAYHKGKPVAVSYRLPVTFQLPADE
jgi:TonB family protein